MQFLSKAWHFLPMAIAGGFIAVKTIYQLLERIMVKTPEDNSKGGMVK
ncbi:hypothetical protein [Enterocloster clostridioformis]|nr:hypothetical protein [Enterocloster clostridioformis]